jgi:hypothetical protein
MKNSLLMMTVALLVVIPILALSQATDVRLVEKQNDPLAPVTRFSETHYAQRQFVHATDPAIAAMVSAINTDSLRATLRELQNWGSRFLMRDNNKEIATSLMNKFLSYGYTDVKLDSFYLVIPNWGGMSDSAWQYNVVCTLAGASAPDEIYVVGGHWDSYCAPDPMNLAPGVDDNGTAVAATLEIARVMKEAGYQPETTIRFTLFAAEELGLFGSRSAAQKARLGGTDLRYMLNLDMISNNPDDSAAIKLYQYLGVEWASYVAADAIERYTDLSVVIPQNNTNSGSDSYPYWAYGFPTVYFEEIAFSPNWHIPSDTLGNCNIPYLKKVTGGALATLAEQQLLPYPQNLWARSAKEKITLTWLPTQNAFVKGVNVYRSDSPGGIYQKITASPVVDSVFNDVPSISNKQYYYVITTVNDSLRESMYSNEVVGARFNFCDTLLVLANTKGNKSTPDSIRLFYQAVLDTIPYKWIDINAEQKIDLAQFSRYRSILWMSNSLENEPVTIEIAQGVMAFIENGGNLLWAGFNPARFWTNMNITPPLYIPETYLFHMLFKVDSVDRKIQSMMFRANAVATGYDTLHVDSLKYMNKSYPGQIYYLDLFAPSAEANVIYRFDSHFDSTTTFGKAKHRPVGLEYMGADHKSILLSFPLYYLDTSDARNFMHYVVTKKFAYPVGIEQATIKDPFDMRVYPNPVKDACNVTFKLERPGRVRISLISPKGLVTSSWLDRKLDSGNHRYRFSMASLNKGLYQVLLQQGAGKTVQKVIKVE